MTLQNYDLIVVGAGISGIAAARFYLEIHPQCRLIMLDRDCCPGGVWNSRRSYEGFWTQWTVGTAQFSDMPMQRPPEDDIYYEFFKARHTTAYLEQYVDHKIIAGRTLRERMKFGFHVDHITKSTEDGSWLLSGHNIGNNSNEQQDFRAPKLLVATGLTSTPNMPCLPNSHTFSTPIYHQETFGQSGILTSISVHRVTVIGGGKSAADMVYACVKAGKSVDWVIRKSGTGPIFFLSPKSKARYKNAFELQCTRMAATVSPSIYNPETWWTLFLHRTYVGQGAVNKVWGRADTKALKQSGFDCRVRAKEGFEYLKPKTPLLWQNGTFGLLNRPGFWESIADNVQVHPSDIQSLRPGAVHLGNGDIIPTDALLCGTGWSGSSFPFFSTELAKELGLPHPECQDLTAAGEEDKAWSDLDKQADAQILARFPQLAHPPSQPPKCKKGQTTPFRLYKGIAPLNDVNDPSIAFVGFMRVSNYIRNAEVQAIWATAYLDGKLGLSSSPSPASSLSLPGPTTAPTSSTSLFSTTPSHTLSLFSPRPSSHSSSSSSSDSPSLFTMDPSSSVSSSSSHSSPSPSSLASLASSLSTISSAAPKTNLSKSSPDSFVPPIQKPSAHSSATKNPNPISPFLPIPTSTTPPTPPTLHPPTPLHPLAHQIALQTSFSRLRYLHAGASGNFVRYETTAYHDRLLEELGLRSHLAKSWVKRYFVPVRPGDLGGLRLEYIGRFGWEG